MLGQVLINHSFPSSSMPINPCMVFKRSGTRREYDLLFVLQPRGRKLDLAPFPIGGVLNESVLHQF